MAVTAHASGTQVATIGTEHVLDHVDAEAGTFTFHVDTVNMAAGDVLELRIYQKILTSGTEHGCYLMRYFDNQATDDEIKVSVPVSTDSGPATNALKFTLLQTKGTGRSFDWKVLKYA